jgi:hypothetical protein
VHILCAHVLVMCCVEVFCERIRKVFLALVLVYVKLFLFNTWSVAKKNYIYINCDHCFLTVSFTIPAAVLLSWYIGVGG